MELRPKFGETVSLSFIKEYAQTTEGERLEKLQRLLKFEELEQEAERKILVEIETETLKASNELCKITWEVRYIDRVIDAISTNRLDIRDANLDFVPRLRNEMLNSNHYLVQLEPSLRKNVESLIAILRLDPSILGDTFKQAKYLENLQTTNTGLCQAIVFSLFGNCFTPTDEKLLLKLIKHLIEMSPMNIRSESFPLTLLSTYLNYTYGKPYLKSVLKDLIMDVLQDPSLNLEVNPEKEAFFENTNIQIRKSYGNGKDKLEVLQEISVKFLRKILENMSSLPYGLRWVAKTVVDMALGSQDDDEFVTPDSPKFPRVLLSKSLVDITEHVGGQERLTKSNPETKVKLSIEEFRRNLIMNIIFENFFVPAILRPAQYGIISGLAIDRRSRNNLVQIAKMLLDLLNNSPASQDILEYHHLSSKVSSYFSSIIQVENLESHFCGTESEYFSELGKTRLMVSSTDLFLLLELIYQNLSNVQEKNIRTKQVLELIQKIQPSCEELQEGMKNFVINVIASDPGESEIHSENPKLKTAKEHLLLLLRVIDYIRNFQENSIVQILEKQSAQNRVFEANIIEAQIKETVKSLMNLPSEYQQCDYALLLDLLYDEHETRERKRLRNRRVLLSLYDQLRRNLIEMQCRKQINFEFLTHYKYKQFKFSENSEESFLDEFVTKFPRNLSPCSCHVTIMENFVCENCENKAGMVSAFMMKIREKLEENELWKNSTEEEIDVAMVTVERHLLPQIYNFTFSILEQDYEFGENLRLRSPSLSQMLIPEKYWGQAPWELAQRELKKITVYKSAHDKLACIIDCWKILFNYIRPVSGEAGPDDYLPIMGFVIIKAQVPHLLSQINYIQLYTKLDVAEEIPFMNFKSAVEILRDTFSTVQWTVGLLKPVSMRMRQFNHDKRVEATLKMQNGGTVRPTILNHHYFQSFSMDKENLENELKKMQIGNRKKEEDKVRKPGASRNARITLKEMQELRLELESNNL